MLLSMTGYSNKTIGLVVEKGNKVSLSIEIKSINSRFFEAVCKLPSALSSLEIGIVNMLKKKLIRGRVYATVRLSEDEGVLQNIKPSLNLVEGYIKAIDSIKKKFKVTGTLSVSDILNFPNIFVSEKREISKNTESAILKHIESVADAVVKTRAAEGKNLQKDLEKRFLICGKRMVQIQNGSKKLMQQLKENIKKTMVLYQKGDEEAKLKLDELYSSLNKIDIHEEIIRFNSHLESVKKVIKDKDIEKGKRIDFVLQELMRESNTILAKCSNFDVSTVSVDIKVELEKAREQAQNVV